MAAVDAITAVGKELESYNVQFSFGPSGTFKEPILSEDNKTWVGVQAVDGTQWFAERIIMATGAWSPALVDLEGQCVSKVGSGRSVDNGVLVHRHPSQLYRSVGYTRTSSLPTKSQHG